MRRFGLAGKISSVIALLALTAVAMAGIGYAAMATYDRELDTIMGTAKRLGLAREADGLIMSVVADSRGIYMARDGAEVESFAKPLLEGLRALEERMGRWTALLPPERTGELDAARARVAEFVAFRSELVRIAREGRFAEARAFGDNDANRSNRKRLNAAIQALAESAAAELREQHGRLGHYHALWMAVLLLVAGAGIGVAVALSLLIVNRGVTAPLRQMTATMAALAAGDATVRVPDLGKRDEIGDMARAVEVFRRNAVERRRLQGETERLQEDATAAKRRATAELLGAFEAKVGGLVQALGAAARAMRESAGTMAVTAEQTDLQSGAVAASAQVTSGNVQLVAAATEELAATAREIGAQVGRSAAITRSAVTATERTNGRIEALAADVQTIGDVVRLISDIASQTNLLALNATIEAARAGEHGRGFAVVAAEVKTLAGQTARATEEIAGRIAGIQGATAAAVEAIGNVGVTIGEVHQIAAAIAAAVEEQQAATAEIARNVTEAAQSTQAVTGNIGDVQRAARSAKGAAGDVLASATALARTSSDLDREVDAFVGSLAAA